MCRLRDQPDWRRDIGDRALKAATDLYSRRAALARWAAVVERIGGEVTTS
jgi:hypothetical protein